MINKFFKSLLGSKSEAGDFKAAGSEHYNGYDIHAAPVKETHGWRVAGMIVKGSGDEQKEHKFARADYCVDQEAAVALTISKAKRLIDEQGERIFQSH